MSPAFLTPFAPFQISTLQSFQFPPLRHLKSVDLSSNFLTSLDRMTFLALGNRQVKLASIQKDFWFQVKIFMTRMSFLIWELTKTWHSLNKT